MKVPLTPVRCLHRAADLYGSKQGVICGPKRFTYAEFAQRCQQLDLRSRARESSLETESDS